MPSAEETTYLIEVMPETGISQDSFISRDVDVLVSRIKENLRLSGLKSRSSLSQQKLRPSPYRLPSEPASACERNNSGSASEPGRSNRCRLRCQRRCGKPSPSLQDSYERFEALLRRNLLIKEAVKRLRTGPHDDYDDYDEDDDVEDKGRPMSTSATSTTIDSVDDD